MDFNVVKNNEITHHIQCDFKLKKLFYNNRCIKLLKENLKSIQQKHLF